ncbi:MAG: antibiotic biosynthesis monooxygenase [Oscillospiraceae bacterium]|nr:antibiotic biosynthesis monooxygenase [Oscillospiraceae bacterium]
MENIVLHVTYTCKTDMAQTFVQAVKDSGVQKLVRAEDGCFQYDYHISCEHPDTVLLLELWRDGAALEQHMRQPHMETLKQLKNQYTLDTQITHYE